MVNETLNRAFAEVGKQGDTHGPMLLGVERGDWRARPEAALKLGRKLPGRGEVAYRVVSPEGRPPESKRANNRAHARERTRLRSAKLLDDAYRFLCEGRICDRSRNGLRLALALDVSLPPQLACTSTNHPKCARRRSSGGAGRQSDFDCIRPRRRTR